MTLKVSIGGRRPRSKPRSIQLMKTQYQTSTLTRVKEMREYRTSSSFGVSTGRTTRQTAVSNIQEISRNGKPTAYASRRADITDARKRNGY